MTESSYDAHSIQILEENEAEERFEWLKLGKLATEYSVPLECIQRGFQACQLTGTSFEEFFIEKYLKKNKTIPKSQPFENAYIELMRQERFNAQSKVVS